METFFQRLQATHSLELQLTDVTVVLHIFNPAIAVGEGGNLKREGAGGAGGERELEKWGWRVGGKGSVPSHSCLAAVSLRLTFPRHSLPRCAALSRVNSLLREQLEQAGSVNSGLAESLWKARGDAEVCDARLRKEQEVREERHKTQVKNIK